MCDKERLVSYLYDDLGDAERTTFERHLRECADCRDELNALRGVRADLISWSPPQPDFGFRVVREPKVVPMPPRTWRAWYTPAAGLAAAAVLVLAAASAIARVEIHKGPDGVTVRTGWASASAPENDRRFDETASRAQSSRGDILLPSSVAAEVDASMIAMLDRRLRALEVASRDSGPVRNASMTGMRAQTSDAEIIRRVREMLAQSETKHQGELALRIAQVLRDVEAQRVEDLRRIQQGLRNVEATVSANEAGHRELTNLILASPNSKQK
jgi:hypothetical protein